MIWTIWYVSIYSVLSDLMNKPAPLITRTIRSHPNAPWYDENLLEMKRKLRRLERRWITSKLEIDKHIFKDSCREYNQMIKQAKQR